MPESENLAHDTIEPELQPSEFLPRQFWTAAHKKISFSRKMDLQKYIGTKDVIIGIDEISRTRIAVLTRFSNTFVIDVPEFSEE